jgi:predicted nucleic acid-binding protein
VVLIDTSVWVSFFRGSDRHLADHLTRLLDEDEAGLPAPARIEILSGASRRDRVLLKEVFLALPVFYPERATWKRMEGWTETAARSGFRFGLGNLLIGAIAADHGAEIWSLDSDFEHLARLRLVPLFRP